MNSAALSNAHGLKLRAVLNYRFTPIQLSRSNHEKQIDFIFFSIHLYENYRKCKH